MSAPLCTVYSIWFHFFVLGCFVQRLPSAIKTFQFAQNLSATGEADRATLETLAADSGSGIENVVRITGDTVNVRRGPGTEYESIAIAHKGDTLPAVAAEDWLPVLFGGEIRWVSMKYASLEPAK